MSLAEKIANFACHLKYEKLPSEAVHETKRRLIDSFGCAMGAWLAEPPKIARDLACLTSSTLGATVIGTRCLSSPELAAFANGTMFRYLDYNDTYLSKEPAHPSDNIAALLAIAEAFGLNGKDLIVGIIASYEVQCRLCDAYSIRKRGWDHVTYGSFSTVAGCGAMLGFTKEQMIHALGLAGIPNNAMRQTRVGELSMWKGCAFANTARNGVFASLLAHMGMTGPSQVFEGEMGFFNQVSRDCFDIQAFGGNGIPFMINQTYIKKFPAEYHSQSAIDAAQHIVAKHGRLFKPEEIQSIKINTFTASYEIIGGEPEKWHPKCRETADHSLPYIVCATLLDGDITLKSFDKKRFTDKAILSTLEKTKVHPDPKLDPIYPHKGIPNHVYVELKDGTQYDKRVDTPTGHALNPMSDGEVVRKFRSMAEPLLRSSQVQEALDLMWELEKQEELDDLMECFVV